MGKSRAEQSKEGLVLSGEKPTSTPSHRTADFSPKNTHLETPSDRGLDDGMIHELRSIL